MKQFKTKKTSQIGSFLKSIDLFGHNVKLRTDNQSYFTSTFGAILSFGILALVGIYSASKFQVLKEHGDTNYQQFTEVNANSNDRVIK